MHKHFSTLLESVEKLQKGFKITPFYVVNGFEKFHLIDFYLILPYGSLCKTIDEVYNQMKYFPHLKIQSEIFQLYIHLIFFLLKLIFINSIFVATEYTNIKSIKEECYKNSNL